MLAAGTELALIAGDPEPRGHSGSAAASLPACWPTIRQQWCPIPSVTLISSVHLPWRGPASHDGYRVEASVGERGHRDRGRIGDAWPVRRTLRQR